ncbi:alpha/beta hydrolase [Planctomicrobium sp. SH664]|uniref:alpha/beta hydrolase n=1 Tax=Planctomicrobium sp. SH664 TaxID=3448125 RepID=UPI003F5C67FC
MSEPAKPRRGLIRLGMLGLLLLGGVLGPIAAFQRRLIYFPSRGPVTPDQAGLPADQIREVRIPGAEGLTLHGWLATPAGTSLAQANRLVLLFPGNGGNRANRADALKVFTQLGCACLICDYRGYGENAGSPSEAGIARDAEAIWNYACTELAFSPDQIVICGESLGGAVATRLASDLCKRDVVPGGLIISMTFTSLADAAAVHYPWIPARVLLIDRFPSIERISAVTCPLLSIHGTADPVVPYELGARLFAAAPDRSRNDIPKTFLTLPDVGHNLGIISNGPVRQAYEEFFNSLPMPVRP